MTPNQAIEYGAKCLEKWKDWKRADQEQIEFYKAAIEALEKEVVALHSVTNEIKPHWECRYVITNRRNMLIGYRCSKCNLTLNDETPYCPMCGAKMTDMNGGNGNEK